MSLSKAPLVSVVIPNYNGSNYIFETIQSVINQTYKNWELIIVDDCSTDDSLKIINGIHDPRVSVVKLQENKGAAVARNTAIEISKGRLIAFLDNDDLWISNKLEKQVGFMLENDLMFTYTDYYKLSEKGKFHIKCIKKVTYNDLLKNNYILTSTVIYNADVLGKIYMENIRKRQDWSLFINVIKESKIAIGLSIPLTLYRKHANSLSAKKTDLVRYNFDFYHKVLGYPKVKSLLLMAQFMVYYFLKKTKERFGLYHR